MALTAAQMTAVRLEIADRGARPQFTDAEIQAVADGFDDNVGKTVIDLIEAQIAELAGRPDFSGGALQINHGKRWTGLRLLLATKRNKYRTYPVVVIDD